MKYIILLLSLGVFVFDGEAQNKWSFGPSLTLGASTIMAPGTGSMHGIGSAKFSVKPAFGLGFTANRLINARWTLQSSLAYQQRGASFDGYEKPSPGYRLNYLDLMIGGQYNFEQNTEKKRNYFGQFALVTNALVNGNRVFSSGSDKITNSFSMLDVGLELAIGLKKARNNDQWQVMFFAQPGFVPVFAGVVKANGFSGNNFLTGIRSVYLFGKSKID